MAKMNAYASPAQAAENFDTLIRDHSDAYYRCHLSAPDDLAPVAKESTWAASALGYIQEDLQHALHNPRGAALLSAFAGKHHRGVLLIDRGAGNLIGTNYPVCVGWNSCLVSFDAKGVVISPPAFSDSQKKDKRGGLVLKGTGRSYRPDELIRTPKNFVVHEISHQLDKNYEVHEKGSGRHHSGTVIYRLLADAEDFFAPRSVSSIAYDTAHESGYSVRQYPSIQSNGLDRQSYEEHFAHAGDCFMGGELPQNIVEPLMEPYFSNIVDLDIQLMNSELSSEEVIRARKSLHEKLNETDRLQRHGLTDLVEKVNTIRENTRFFRRKYTGDAEPSLLEECGPKIESMLAEIAAEVRRGYKLPPVSYESDTVTGKWQTDIKMQSGALCR